MTNAEIIDWKARALAAEKALRDIIETYEWCSADPVDRGYSTLDNEIMGARSLLAAQART